MTITEILSELKASKKRVSRQHLYTYFDRMKIKPISKQRQIPQQYPADTAVRIKLKLGIAPNGLIVVTPKVSKSKSR